MPSVKKSLEKFYSLAPEVVLTVDSAEISSRMEALNRKYNINLAALIIFYVTGDIDFKDIKAYIEEEFGVVEKIAEKILKDFNEQIAIPITKRLLFLDANPKKDDQQKKIDKETLLKIFNGRLVKELKRNPIIINAINVRVFYNLDKDFNFKIELEKGLLSNKEKITTKDFLLDGRKKPGTIENWLKYFIKDQGSEIFDNLKLSKFLIDSPNVKPLPIEEKELLNDILTLYRNIKFFPESMPNDTGEGWAIIPTKLEKEEKRIKNPKKHKKEEIDPEEMMVFDYVNKEEEQKIVPLDNNKKESDNNKKEVNEEEIEDLEDTLEQYEEGSLERMAIEEEIKDKKNKVHNKKSQNSKEQKIENNEIDKEIEDLEKSLEKYEEGSLERMALKEEINQLKKKNKK